MDNFPNWEIAYYDNTESAFQAVADGKQMSGLSATTASASYPDLIEKNKLAVLATGEVMDVSFAVRQEDDCLYSILNKITGLIPDATVNSLLTNYSLRENGITFGEFIQDKSDLLYFRRGGCCGRYPAVGHPEPQDPGQKRKAVRSFRKRNETR